MLDIVDEVARALNFFWFSNQHCVSSQTLKKNAIAITARSTLAMRDFSDVR